MSFSWSFSRLKNFELCPRRHWHYDIAKDVGDANFASSEGQDNHKAFHERIHRKKPLPLPLLHHEPLLAKLAAIPGETHTEMKLALTVGYQPCGFFDRRVWFRTVLDFCNVRGAGAAIIDYKFGRPAPDKTQLELMAATVMHYMPSLERVKAALLFVNHDKAERAEYRPTDLPGIWNQVLPRVAKLQMAVETQEFPPTPNGLCKQWCNVTSCPYHGRGSR